MPKISGNFTTYGSTRSREQIATDNAKEKRELLYENKIGKHGPLKKIAANFREMMGGEKIKMVVEEKLNSPVLLNKEQALAGIKSNRSQNFATPPKKNADAGPPPPTHIPDPPPDEQLQPGNGPPPPTYIPLPPPDEQLQPGNGPPPPTYIPLPPSDEQLQPGNGPPAPTYIPEPPKAKQNDAQPGVIKKKTVQLSKTDLKDARVMKETVTRAVSNYLKDSNTHGSYSRENFPKMLADLDKCLGLAEGKPTLAEVGLLLTLSDNIKAYMPDEIGKLDLILERALLQSSNPGIESGNKV